MAARAYAAVSESDVIYHSIAVWTQEQTSAAPHGRGESDTGDGPQLVETWRRARGAGTHQLFYECATVGGGGGW